MSPPKYVLIRWLGRRHTRWRFRQLVGREFRLTESLRSEANATAPRIRHAWSHVQLLRCPDRAMPGVSTAFGFLVVNRGGSRHYWVATFKGAVVTDNAIDSFTEFVRRVEPRLRLALVASFGVRAESGTDRTVCKDALSHDE